MPVSNTVAPPKPIYYFDKPVPVVPTQSRSAPPASESKVEAQREEADEGNSEIGDGDESVSGSGREGGTTPSSRAKGAAKAKAKPRKSKLAQEIHPASAGVIIVE